MPVVRTACPLDCPDACSLAVTVTEGRITQIDGDDRNPLTASLVCGKVRGAARHVYGPERILTPGIRVGAKGEGRFRSASWDEALDLVALRFQEAQQHHGGEAILPICYGGSNGLLSQDGLDARLFFRVGASRLERTVCAAPSGRAHEGLYGKLPGVALHDYVHSRLIVLWGVNPSASGIHHVPVLDQARKAGARIVVVDPRRTPLAKKADLHLAVRPGTDLCVALAIHDWLFSRGRADLAFLAARATGTEVLRERAAVWPIDRAAAEAGIAPEDLEQLAQWLADVRPAVVRCGWGPERNRNGGSATAAILALPAVAGAFGQRGGGYTMSNSRALPLARSALARTPEPATRRVNMNRLGRALTELDDPPVTVLFSYNCNPLATMPAQETVRRGLLRDDLFTVVHDAVYTDTARYADVVLPATTFFEHDDLTTGYGAIVLNRVTPVIAAVGEARSNVEVFAALLHRLGLARPDEPETPQAQVADILAHTPDGARLAAALADDGIAFPAQGAAPMPLVDEGPRTSDGKIHLAPPELDAEAPLGLYVVQPDPATSRHPLALISPASSKTTSSTFGQLDRRRAAIAIHPHDAAARDIHDGDRVRVFNERGEVVCRAHLDADVRPGVVSLAKGLWSHHTENGATANALAPDDLADLGGGATFNDARVEVLPLPAAPG